MDQVERIFKALHYIEECLPYTADLKEIAERANMSPYHFHRTFTSIIGEPVGKYCQKRRLTMAAKRLLYSNEKILNIAMSHGYDSQATFSVAFKKMFSISPNDFRQSMTEIPVFSTDPLSLIKLFKENNIIAKAEKISKNDFLVVGILGFNKLDKNFVKELVEDFLKNTDVVREESPKYSINKYMSDLITEKNPKIQFVGIEINNKTSLSDKILNQMIPKQKYIVFGEKKSYEQISKSYDFIYGIWLPKSKISKELKDKIEVEITDKDLDLLCSNDDIKVILPLK